MTLMLELKDYNSRQYMSEIILFVLGIKDQKNCASTTMWGEIGVRDLPNQRTMRT